MLANHLLGGGGAKAEDLELGAGIKACSDDENLPNYNYL